MFRHHLHRLGTHRPSQHGPGRGGHRSPQLGSRQQLGVGALTSVRAIGLGNQPYDTYFVVAHFHYVLFGTIVFSTFADIYFWFPKMTGRLLDERLGKLHFWPTFIGFHMTLLVQHWLATKACRADMPTAYPPTPSQG